VPGYDIRVLDDEHGEVPPGTVGTIAVRAATAATASILF